MIKCYSIHSEHALSGDFLPIALIVVKIDGTVSLAMRRRDHEDETIPAQSSSLRTICALALVRLFLLVK